MANFQMNVNTNAAIILTAKLERMHKSAFPSAVRSTLNDSAFAMKQKEILDSAKLNMTVRNPSFFKKFTGVKRANGFNVNAMFSEDGFQDRGQNSARKAINKSEFDIAQKNVITAQKNVIIAQENVITAQEKSAAAQKNVTTAHQKLTTAQADTTLTKEKALYAANDAEKKTKDASYAENNTKDKEKINLPIPKRIILFKY